MKHFKRIVSIPATLLLPISVFAQTTGGAMSKISNAQNLIDRLTGLGNTAVYLLVALAVLYIVYSTVRYFIMGKEGDEHRREAGMQILWGIVGLFVIVSLWGLVNILVNTFPTGDQSPSGDLPSADFINGGVNLDNVKPASNDYFDTPPPSPSNSNGLTPA